MQMVNIGARNEKGMAEYFALTLIKQEELKKDLKDRVPSNYKPKPGKNTFTFGDNRQGKCGVGSFDDFVIN